MDNNYTFFSGMDHSDVDTNSQICTPFLPLFKKTPGHASIGKGIQAIFPSLVIHCNGYITSWQAYTRHAIENDIHFQIWRPVEAGLFNLVGENTLMNARSTMELVTLNVSPSDYIQVQIGDVIGIYVGNINKGIEVKTKPDMNSGGMWYYRLNNSPSIGSQLQLTNQLLSYKDELPIIAISFGKYIQQYKVFMFSCFLFYIAETDSSTIESSSTSTHSSKPSSTSSIELSQQRTLTAGHIQTPAIQSTNSDETSNCNDDEDESMFPMLLVLIMTIAILLLVVFILGTALVLVSLKLRHTTNGSAGSNTTDTTSGGSNMTTTSGSNKNTFVGKQIFLIEEGKGISRRKDNLKPQICQQSSIENPSYVIESDNSEVMRTRPTNVIDRETVRTIMENIPEIIRERTDSDSTVTTRGFNAQEYEDPQINNNIQLVSQPLQNTRGHYSHPRTFTHRQAVRTIPVECNVSYSQPPSIRTSSHTAVSSHKHIRHSGVQHV